MTATADFGSSLVNALMRGLAAVLLALGIGLLVVFAFAAALVVALMVFGAAVALRFWPARGGETARPGPDAVLEARRTPSGWVVEGGARR